MKDKIVTTILIMISITCGLTLLIVMFAVLPWWGFSLLVFLGFLRFLIYKADKEYDNMTLENQKLLENLYDETDKVFSLPKAPIPKEPKPDLLQIAEMYRDHMEGSPEENSLAYNVTVKAIDNYYKKAN